MAISSDLRESGSPWLKTLKAVAALATTEGIEEEVQALGANSAPVAALTALAPDERIGAGFGHTLREVAQQPLVWADTAMRAAAFGFGGAGAPPGGHVDCICLTGSGSSEYAGELAAPAMEARLGVPVRTIPSGDLLTYGAAPIPPGRALLISLARSGNSPESVAAIRVVMRERPETRFLNVTCNAQGRLAVDYTADPRVSNLLLHPRTQDESLVMTSSFTSMSLALSGLFREIPSEGPVADRYLEAATRLCKGVRERMPQTAEAVAALRFSGIQRALFLGGGCQRGAAREAALKLTEMTAGRIVSMHETFLGLRHGPMAAVDAATLVVALLPVTERPRRYALDLLAELRRKGLGAQTLVVDDGVRHYQPDSLDAAASADGLPEELAALEGVVAGQWLGFFACLHHGLRPDAPAATGIITRVVQPFPIYE